ncbi:hypothetical protein B9057_15885 (plasmid) [Aestuarium zhoushanense]|nr:hypothetical protein B9057_15885 [Aestuarium zhoushanense]
MLGELINRWPATVPVFLGHKMLCVGCLVNPFHTIADACLEYDLEPLEFVAELNAAISADGEIDVQVIENNSEFERKSLLSNLFGKPR